MTTGENITRAIRRANARGQAALVAFFTAGYPTPRGFAECLHSVAAQADLVEIGVPFSDPMADGVSIQRASHAALRAGVSLEWILGALEHAAADAPVLLMSYLNPLLSFGVDRLAARAAASRVSGIIVPDMPLEESGEFSAVLDAAGVALVQLVSPLTPGPRLERLCEASRGFVYAVTSTGTTGRTAELPAQLPEYLARVRACSSLPVCAGFGIRYREQVESLAAYADGVVVGSALVEALERGEDPGEFLAGLKPRRAAARAD